MTRSLLILISVIAGISLGYLTDSILLGIFLVFLSIVTRWLIIRKSKRNFSRFVYSTRLHYVWPCLILSGLGVISGVWNRPNPYKIKTGEEYKIIGMVMDRITTTNGERYLIEIEKLVTSEYEIIICRNISTLLFTSGDRVLEIGDVIDYKSVLHQYDSVKNYGMGYVTYDKTRVYQGITSKNGKEKFFYRTGEIHIREHRRGILQTAWKLREDFTVFLENSKLTTESAQLMRALLTGKRTGIDDETLKGFKDAGVVHTLAVSGMHIGIFTIIMLWLTLPLNLIRGRKIRFTLIIVGTWIFTIFTGLQLSTIRSALMLTLTALAFLTGKKRNAFGALCMAAVIVLLASPSALWDPGFQLSFTCVLSLCLLVNPLNPIDRSAHPRLYAMIGLLLPTIVTTGVTWVISAYYFGSMPIHFFIANIILLPVLPIIMGLGILYVSLVGCGLDMEFLANIINWSTEILYRFINYFSGRSLIITPSVVTVTIWLCAVVLLIAGLHWYRNDARTLPGAEPIPYRLRPDGCVLTFTPLIVGACVLFVCALLLEYTVFN